MYILGCQAFLFFRVNSYFGAEFLFPISGHSEFLFPICLIHGPSCNFTHGHMRLYVLLHVLLLVDSCTPGDLVTLSGSVKVQSLDEGNIYVCFKK